MIEKPERCPLHSCKYCIWCKVKWLFRLVCSQLGATIPTYGWENMCCPGIQKMFNGEKFLGLQTAQISSEKTARWCTNDFRIKLCRDIQIAADIGNAERMYEGIRKAVSPMVRRTGPIKSARGVTLTGEKEQMGWWVVFSSDLYSTKHVVDPEAQNSVECLPVMHDLNNEPNICELEAVIAEMATGKAPEVNGIPPAVLKSLKWSSLRDLHNILIQCWMLGTVPQDMRDSLKHHHTV